MQLRTVVMVVGKLGPFHIPPYSISATIVFLRAPILQSMSDLMISNQVGRESLPLTVYRVDYPGAQTTYSQQWGFLAAGNFTPHHVTGLRRSVEYHLNWQCRTPSPYISVFSNRQHALNWARVWSENNGYGTCDIVEIRIKREHGVMVFCVADLVTRFRVPTTLMPAQYHSEYLCFRCIPSEAIVRRDPVYQGMRYKQAQNGVMRPEPPLEATLGFVRVVLDDSDDEYY
jgi:hypothetical protein